MRSAHDACERLRLGATLTCPACAPRHRSLNGDKLDNCFGRDVCFCVRDGLRVDGVREAYCLVLYPNTSGYPP